MQKSAKMWEWTVIWLVKLLKVLKLKNEGSIEHGRVILQ